MRRHHTGGDNIITWKVVETDTRFSIVYSPNAMLFVAIPIWWSAMFVFCFLFYRFADAPFNMLAVLLGVATALLHAVIVGYRLHKEKQRGDYLHLDMEAKTIELPRSYTKATWDQQPPQFFIDCFKDYQDSMYEFNVQLDDGRFFFILHSSGSTFRNISSKLARFGFAVQKRCHKEN